MLNRRDIIQGVAYVIPLNPLRDTPNVHFHDVPQELTKDLAAIDRVEHGVGAFSPIAKDRPELRAWYMHPSQEDNLLVVCGQRNIELYTVEHGRIERFEATPHFIKHEGNIVHDGPALLGWGVNVFHRVVSPGGSISMNFARHFKGFDKKENFNIYELDEATGKYSVVRAGHLDQPVQDVGE